MININLLPVEFRKAESTPVARFIAIVVGAVVVTASLVGYGYVHYSKLKEARDVRMQTEETYANKKAQADVSKSLQTEINNYELRRKAIQSIAQNRILNSKKLDEFLDIIWARGDKTDYYIWLNSMSVRPGRTPRKGKPTSGGTLTFGGFSEGEFNRITNLKRAISDEKSFFSDFKQISMPGFKKITWDDEREPSSAGRFSFTLQLKPLGWNFVGKRKK